ncbi:MAG: hypothetical protein OM95_16275 [Bdellovibrio sp. ArHS]|uniref:hypothetical protein n=1 Tax=Bdellovibrio sp. ArHS TaxID=1569284 RepID=UPI000582DBD7|nr:hypothetical protein [Bdellovibrio sp. ArHS]KHD87105.1 MAG: hypothetical protein OM95_16275 [Bdellovibrio sp. ArHS]
MRLSIIFVLSLITLNTKALPIVSGHERGNGGLQLQCHSENSAVPTIASLDRMEGTLRDGRTPAKSLLGYADENEIVLQVLTKLEIANPTRAKAYRQAFKTLLKNRIFSEGLIISPTNDGDVVLIPPHCHLIQGAVFIGGGTQEKRIYLFDKASWDQTSALDKAYLLLHEIIYQEALLPENSHQNAAATRNLNSWLFSHLDDLDQNSWNQQLALNGFSYGDYNGIAIQLTYTQTFTNKRLPAPVKYYPSGELHKAVLYSSFTLQQGSVKLSRECAPQKHTRQFDSYVEFQPSGKVKRLVLSEPLFKSPGCGLYLDTFNDLTFSSEGDLEGARYTQPEFFHSF